jgi:hypothetical protein
MKKDVVIFIKGIQDIDGEKDTIEMLTKGKYYKEKAAGSLITTRPRKRTPCRRSKPSFRWTVPKR